VHCDLVLPASAAGIDWSQRFPRADFAAVDDRFEWIAIGWGDRGFYLEVPRAPWRICIVVPHSSAESAGRGT